jgi:hypothetical protein
MKNPSSAKSRQGSKKKSSPPIVTPPTFSEPDNPCPICGSTNKGQCEILSPDVVVCAFGEDFRKSPPTGWVWRGTIPGMVGVRDGFWRKGGTPSTYVRSGIDLPCPICGSKRTGECTFLEDGKAVVCNRGKNYCDKAPQGWKFLIKTEEKAIHPLDKAPNRTFYLFIKGVL